MKNELKKEFAMRISQANNVQMIIIAYEMVQTYIQDALDSKDNATAYTGNIELASKCIDELKANLHYEYEPAKALKELYLYMKSRLRDARYNKDYEALTEIDGYVSKLKESYESIKDMDTSDPLMSNTQSVLTGITYGRNQVLDELSNDIGNRGYLV